MDIYFKAKKLLSPMSSYKSAEDVPISILKKIANTFSGNIVGVYENTLNCLENSIVITDKELILIRDSNVKTIFFEDINDVIGSENKAGFYAIKLMLNSGEIFEVEILNGNKKFKDIYEFLRFLKRVVDHKLYQN